MKSADKIPKPLGPELIETLWSGRGARRMFWIIAEFAEATAGGNSATPAVSIFGREKCGFDSSARKREAQRDL